MTIFKKNQLFSTPTTERPVGDELMEDLKKSMVFLEEVIEQRLKDYKNGRPNANLQLSKAPTYKEHTIWGDFCLEHVPTIESLIVLLLALAPQVIPDFLDRLVKKYFPAGGKFPLFGGVTGKNHRGILPTGETALFILAGQNICLLYTSPSPRDATLSRMPSSA